MNYDHHDPEYNEELYNEELAFKADLERDFSQGN